MSLAPTRLFYVQPLAVIRSRKETPHLLLFDKSSRADKSSYIPLFFFFFFPALFIYAVLLQLQVRLPSRPGTKLDGCRRFLIIWPRDPDRDNCYATTTTFPVIYTTVLHQLITKMCRKKEGQRSSLLLSIRIWNLVPITSNALWAPNDLYNERRAAI